MIAKKYIDAQYSSVLFFPVFVSSHLRSFAANSLSAIRRLGYSSRQIITISRSHNCFRMNTYFARFSPHLSPFRINTSGSVHSKQLYPPLESTLMKKRGRGVQFLLTRNPKRIPALRSIATKDLFTHGSRATPISSFSFPVSLCGGMLQYDMGPTSFSTSAMSTITMASHGQPSRKQPSGPLLRHFLHPMHWRGSIWMRPNGGLSSSGTQNMQSSTGQYSTQAGDPAQPVQHSVITASSLGFFLRAVEIPFERGSCFSSSGTIPGALTTCGSAGLEWDFTSNVKHCNRDSRRPS